MSDSDGGTDRTRNKSMDVLFPQVERDMVEMPDGLPRMVYVRSDDLCRVCGEEVVDGRWNYCSERCREIANAVQAMFLWDKVREKVLERDDYTCQECGLSKSMQWRAYRQSQQMLDSWDPVPKAPTGGFFHVDHIQRIADGGHEFDESNLQTLCKHCHQEKTAAENRESEPETAPDITLEDYIES